MVFDNFIFAKKTTSKHKFNVYRSDSNDWKRSRAIYPFHMKVWPWRAGKRATPTGRPYGIATKNWFENDAKRFGYIHQLAFYQNVIGKATNQFVNVYLIAVEKREPYRCGVWQITTTATSSERGNLRRYASITSRDCNTQGKLIMKNAIFRVMKLHKRSMKWKRNRKRSSIVIVMNFHEAISRGPLAPRLHTRSRWKCVKLGLHDSVESCTISSIGDEFVKVKLLGVRNDGFFDFWQRISTVGAIAQADTESPANRSDQGGAVARGWHEHQMDDANSFRWKHYGSSLVYIKPIWDCNCNMSPV